MKFYSYAFGCRVNEAEKQTIDKQMINEGFIFDEKNPDVYIINTCSVTQKAEREARNLIYKIKKNLPETKIVITGCSATYWQKNQLYKDLPVDLLIDNTNKEFLVKIIKKRLLQSADFNQRGHKKPGITTQKSQISSKFLQSGRMMIKIQDGCQRFCSFCIVPYLRGLPKSRKINEIISIIKNEEKNISELILTAINTEAFGYDTGEKLTDLIDEVIKKTNVPRISFGSIHPWSITIQFINFYQKILTASRLVNFFHIPLQSGSNTILHLMKRGYTIQEILEKTNALQKINPLAFLATDVIVGFLGETDKEFDETYEFLGKSPFSRFHVFRFSKRKNTASFFMAKKIKEPDEKTKKIRSQALRDLSAKKYFGFLEKNLNRFSTALMINKKTNGFYEGLLENQLPTLIKSDKNLTPGKIVRIKTKEIKSNFLISKLV